MDDFWFRYVADLWNAGPDKGKGGKFLFLPPGYTDKVPKGYFAFKSRAFGNIFFTRAFLVNGDPAPAVESFHKIMRTCTLSEAANPHPAKFVSLSGKAFNTVAPTPSASTKTSAKWFRKSQPTARTRNCSVNFLRLEFKRVNPLPPTNA